jgi:hypothetical protein
MADLEEAQAVTPAELSKWYLLKKQLAEVKTAESLMRSRIAKFFFPTPDEGTNTHPLKDGTGANLKMVHTIDRKVDEGELEALREALSKAEENPQDNLHGLELDFTKLIVWKPELKIAEYRKLTEAQRAVFDRILVVKPGMPQLDITIPKRGS